MRLETFPPKFVKSSQNILKTCTFRRPQIRGTVCRFLQQDGSSARSVFFVDIVFFCQCFVRKNCSSDQELKFFEMTGIIYSNSESSEQFLVTECSLACSWRFVRSNKFEQLEFKLEKLIVFEKQARKVSDLVICTKSKKVLVTFENNCSDAMSVWPMVIVAHFSKQSYKAVHHFYFGQNAETCHFSAV